MTKSTILALAAALIAPLAAQAADGVARGAYLARIMDCGSRTPARWPGSPMRRISRGRGHGLRRPWPGSLLSAQPYPDLESGFGTWSEEDIIRAVRTGRARRPGTDGDALALLRGASDESAAALAAYLRILPPLENRGAADRRAREGAGTLFCGGYAIAAKAMANLPDGPGPKPVEAALATSSLPMRASALSPPSAWPWLAVPFEPSSR